jgi:hypothetical protein
VSGTVISRAASPGTSTARRAASSASSVGQGAPPGAALDLSWLLAPNGYQGTTQSPTPHRTVETFARACQLAESKRHAHAAPVAPVRVRLASARARRRPRKRAAKSRGGRGTPHRRPQPRARPYGPDVRTERPCDGIPRLWPGAPHGAWVGPSALIHAAPCPVLVCPRGSHLSGVRPPRPMQHHRSPASVWGPLVYQPRMNRSAGLGPVRVASPESPRRLRQKSR